LEKAPEAFRIISEVADDLDVPQHVLRFWESRFTQIRPMKRGGGRRYYRPDDIDLLRGIRHLLYSKGYTIRGVQSILREQGIPFVQSVWREGATQPPLTADSEESAERSRGLLGLIPGFRKPAAETDEAEGDEADSEEVEADGEIDEDADEEEATERREPVFAAPAPTPPRLSRDQVLQLQMALDGLGECRRLLDATLQEA
jgi:DNA-binding transcriptional MerR regulator